MACMKNEIIDASVELVKFKDEILQDPNNKTDATNEESDYCGLLCKFCKDSFTKHVDLVLHLEKHIEDIMAACRSCCTFFDRRRRSARCNRVQNTFTEENKMNIVKHKLVKISRKKAKLADISNENIDDVFTNDMDCDDIDHGPSSESKIAPSLLKNKLFKCNKCDLCFNRKFNYRRHMIKHEVVSRPFMCIKCGKCFGTNAHLNQHMVTHTEVKPFTCNICEKGFKRKDHLEIHHLVHSAEKVHMCSTCGKCYGQKSALNVHIKSVHYKLKSDTNRQRDSHVCTICGKSFFDKNYIKSHILKIHLKERPFACASCGQSFNDKSLLNIHLRTHSGNKPFKCANCSEGFATRRELTIHMVEHTGTKPFACEVCEKSFISKGDLKRHVRVHSGDKPYKCYSCNKAFTQKCHLNSHMKSLHPGIDTYRPFPDKIS